MRLTGAHARDSKRIRFIISDRDGGEVVYSASEFRGMDISICVNDNTLPDRAFFNRSGSFRGIAILDVHSDTISVEALSRVLAWWDMLETWWYFASGNVSNAIVIDTTKVNGARTPEGVFARLRKASSNHVVLPLLLALVKP